MFIHIAKNITLAGVKVCNLCNNCNDALLNVLYCNSDLLSMTQILLQRQIYLLNFL